MPDRIDRREDWCPHCHVRRVADLDLMSRQATVGLAADCPHKDKCEQEIMPGFRSDEAKR